MKTKQKLLIISLLFLIIMLSSCATVHETATTQPKMSLNEAMASMKEAIKDTKQDPWQPHIKVVTNVAVSEDGMTLINSDNTKRYYDFKNIIDPEVIQDNIAQHSFIQLKKTLFQDIILFTNTKSAKMFADALYSLKHMDIKTESERIKTESERERERERENCLRLIRQTPIDLILAGTTANELTLPCSGMARDSLESMLTDILIEWEARGLRERLQKSSSSQLTDLVINLEKGIFKLEHKAKELKDAADEDARQVTAPGQAAPAKKAPGALSLAHLIDQRKTILMVILGSAKQAAAQRSAGG